MIIKFTFVKMFEDKDIKKNDITLFFCVPLSPTNFKPIREVEQIVRDCVGLKIDKEVAKGLGLPNG